MKEKVLRIQEIFNRDKMFDENKISKIIKSEVIRSLEPIMEVEKCMAKINVLKNNRGYEVVVLLKAKEIYV